MKNDDLIRFRLPSELKAEALAFCNHADVSVGAWLRALMRDSLERKPLPHELPGRNRPLKLSDGTTLTRR